MDTQNKMTTAGIIILLGAIFLFGYTWYTKKAPMGEPSHNTTHSIVLSEDGFIPKNVIIKKGDIITFTSTKGSWFWPASNPHPTHTTYATFDPKEPIPSDKNWSFMFTENGKWNYHDHLAPYFIGTIIVDDTEKTISITP